MALPEGPPLALPFSALDAFLAGAEAPAMALEEGAVATAGLPTAAPTTAYFPRARLALPSFMALRQQHTEVLSSQSQQPSPHSTLHAQQSQDLLLLQAARRRPHMHAQAQQLASTITAVPPLLAAKPPPPPPKLFEM